MKIKLSDVIDKTITNKKVLERFNIKFLSNYLTRRRLIFVGEIIRIKKDRVPARLSSIFYYSAGPIGRPNSLIRHSFISVI